MDVPEFNVKVYRGNNSIQLAKTDSGILTTINSSKVTNKYLMVANIKQLISYHMLRMISQNFNYIDKDIYSIVDNYVRYIDLQQFLDSHEDGCEALKSNMKAEMLKIMELLAYYGKKTDNVYYIEEEINALVDKIFKSF